MFPFDRVEHFLELLHDPWESNREDDADNE